MKVTRTIFGIAGAMALATGIAVAGDDDKKRLSAEQKELFSMLDADGDGVISEAEAQRYPELAQRFRDYDQNRDGVLEVAEFARFEIPDEHHTPEEPPMQ